MLILIVVLLLLWLLIFINSKIRFKRDKAFLEEKGYCNLVSAGDYSVNVLSYGNENGKHRIIAVAGYGVPDSCVTMRKMTAVLETDHQVIFIDRAGYGISDDTTQDMTVENITEAYQNRTEKRWNPSVLCADAAFRRRCICDILGEQVSR